MVKALRVFFFTLDDNKSAKIRSELEKLGFKIVDSQVVPGFYYAESQDLKLKERVEEIVSIAEDWKVSEIVV